MTILVLRGNIYRPGILFARVATGAHKTAVVKLVNLLNFRLDVATHDCQERDQVASFWIGQDQARIFPTHCKYLMYRSYEMPFLIIPQQEPLSDLIKILMPVGMENKPEN